LLEFVGNTSTQLTYSIRFCYMLSEKDDKISWALERCHELLHSKTIYPNVVVTNRDNALLREYHIERNVRAKCKMDCKVKDLKGKDEKEIKPSKVVKTAMRVWEDIVDSDTKQAYSDNCNRFKVVREKFPKFLEYVESTILGPVKEKVVKFWFNKVMHMKNTATNRAKPVHNRLKKYLTSSMSDLSINWKSIQSMLESQHTQIHASFYMSIIMLGHRFK